MANGATVTLTLTAVVRDGTGGVTIPNNAAISASDQPDPVSTNNYAAVSVTVKKSCDLAITKTVDNAMPYVGNHLLYTITVTNNGPDAATGINVNDILPVGVTFFNYTPSQGLYDAATGIWNLGPNTLASGASASMALNATVDPLTQGKTITNSASRGPFDQTDLVPANDTAQLPVTVQFDSDLAVTKTVDNPSPGVGSAVFFRVTLANNGPADASNVQVLDIIPGNLTLTSATPSVGNYNSATGIWTVPALANGASATLDIKASVNQVSSGVTITNIAQIIASTPPDLNTSNNLASVDLFIPLKVDADLAVTKTTSNSIPMAGDTVRWTITVKNNGPGDATNVQLSDLLPSGLTYSGSTPSQGAYVTATGIWSVGSLPVGQTATLLLNTVMGVGQVGSTLINTASVASLDQTDPNPANNSASVSLYRPGILWRPNREQTVSPGTPLTYLHQFDTLLGGQSGTLTLTPSSSQGLTWVIYQDTNGNGLLDASDAVWVNGSSVSSGSQAFFLRAMVPSSVPPGWTDTTTITATLTVGASSITRTVTDITHTSSAGAGAMVATKEVAVDRNCNGSLADELPADQVFSARASVPKDTCAIYRIRYRNLGSGSLSGVSVQDQTPAYTTYVAGSAAYETTPAGLTTGTITAPAGGGTGALVWPYNGSLTPGASGSVLYEIRLNP